MAEHDPPAPAADSGAPPSRAADAHRSEAPEPGPAISIHIDAKRFADPGSGVERLILSDLHFDLGQGEFLAVIGPSGCGKSTLLHLIAGLDPGFEGRVDWATGPSAAGRRLGYCFQNPRLLPWLKVRANVEIGLRRPRAHAKRVDALLAAMDLGDFAHFHPARLSLGMQRRAALARAFVIEPQLLLMDEPFVSLDVPTADQLRRLLLQVWERERSSILFVTHDLREATLLADRILFLSACPSRVIGEARVDIPRSRRGDETLVAARYAELKATFDALYPGSAVRGP